MTPEEEQLLLNEFNSLQRQVEQRARDVTSLEDLIGPGTFRAKYPRWYNVEFDFTPGDTEAQERSFFVAGGTYFQPRELTSTLRVTGTSTVITGSGPTTVGDGQVITVSVPYGPSLNNTKAYYRQNYFDFLWEVRDTSDNADWQSEPQPSIFLGGGGLQNLKFPVPGTVRGGSEVFVRILPFYSLSGTDIGRFQALSSYKLTVTFFGLEAR